MQKTIPPAQKVSVKASVPYVSIAVVVLASNNCGYFQLQHGEALNHYWKDDVKIKQLRKYRHGLYL